MSLQSQLFRGDPDLEAAAASDPRHIVPGASGRHVLKIQTALMLLDTAAISADEVQGTAYGASTASAVLAYKQKRSIINTSYQTQADSIVGRMTMASLDLEMLTRESLPRARVQIMPTSFSRVHAPRSRDLLALLDRSQPLGVNGATSSVADAPPRFFPGPGLSVPPAPSTSPTVVLEMQKSSIGSFVVAGGAPGDVVIRDPALARIAPDAPVLPADRALVLTDPQSFRVFSGRTLGRTTITVNSLGSSASLDVVVKSLLDPPKFVEGVNHGHKPSGRYADVQANPNNGPGVFGALLETACKFTSAEGLVAIAKRTMFTGKPIALKHLDAYLTDGKGADFVEDDNIRDWLTRDSGIRSRLKREIFGGRGTPKGDGHFFFGQDGFAVEDFQFAFGAIDRVDFEVDFSRDTVRVWFQDRYEWHPFYPFYDLQAGDGVRETNCLHAAMVELKTSGAADFWMKGQAEVALSLIVRS